MFVTKCSYPSTSNKRDIGVLLYFTHTKHQHYEPGGVPMQHPAADTQEVLTVVSTGALNISVRPPYLYHLYLFAFHYTNIHLQPAIVHTTSKYYSQTNTPKGHCRWVSQPLIKSKCPPCFYVGLHNIFIHFWIYSFFPDEQSVQRSLFHSAATDEEVSSRCGVNFPFFIFILIVSTNLVLLQYIK